MKYIVINKFNDLDDKKHEYNVGDFYPREGVDVTEERLKELSTNANRRKKPLIKLVEADGKKPKKPKAKNDEKDEGKADENEKPSTGEN